MFLYHLRNIYWDDFHEYWAQKTDIPSSAKINNFICFSLQSTRLSSSILLYHLRNIPRWFPWILAEKKHIPSQLHFFTSIWGIKKVLKKKTRYITPPKSNTWEKYDTPRDSKQSATANSPRPPEREQREQVTQVREINSLSAGGGGEDNGVRRVFRE